MKNKFFKLLLPAAAVFFICNCSEEVITGSDYQTAYVVDKASWIYNDGEKDYLIAVDGIVTDTDGNIVGAADVNAGLIVAMDQSIIAQGVDFSSLDVIQPTVVTSNAWVLAADQNYVIYPDGNVTLADGTPVGLIFFSESNPTVGDIIAFDGTTLFEAVDVSELKVFTANVTPTPIPASSATVIDPGISSESNYFYSSTEQPVVSSASAPASSNSVKSSSSSVSVSSSSTTVAGGCPTITTKNGSSGSGWATRYWDCCKPSCSWQENAGGNLARQCTNKGKTSNTNWSDGSICSGGSQMACTSQIPFTIDGCTDMAFAFAAVPASNGGSCGKCFQLTFTGEGHYSSTNANTKKLKGKKLIIMATNVGTDVEQGQFDIMIPGGGVGMYNGCSSMGWGSQGEQYGGLLSECEKETNYSAAKYASCLTEKCNSSFANDSEAKQGCLFLATWMYAAGNPEHTYTEVECPQVLIDRY